MTSLSEIEHAADLKGELVEYALTPGFARVLAAETVVTAEYSDTPYDAMVHAVENLLFERPARSRKTLLDRYLLGHKQLRPDDRALLESWRDQAVFGAFAITARKGARLTLVNLLDELTYETICGLGAEVIAGATRGSYLLTRVLPVGDEWMLSGVQRLFATRDRAVVDGLLTALVESDPMGAFRNPAKRERALAIHRAHHAIFLSLFGGDSVAGTGQEAIDHWYRFTAACSAASVGGKVARPASASASASTGTHADAPAMGVDEGVTDKLLEVDDVVLLHDPVKGIALFRNHGRVEEAYRNPPADVGAAGVALVRDYLDDESIPGYVLTRLAGRYRENVDALFRLVLEKPEFSWANDGDALLRERKPDWYSTADLPDPFFVFDRAVDVAGTWIDATAEFRGSELPLPTRSPAREPDLL